MDDLPELAPYLPDLDDLEDELGAVLASTPEPTVPDQAAPDQGASDRGAE